MIKFTTLALLSFGLVLGCSSSTTTTRTTTPATTAATATALADAMRPVSVPHELTLTATTTRCYCADGWSFAMSPCNQTQCGNLCTHGHQAPGFCR